MITKFSSDREKYMVLFEKATKRLQDLNIFSTGQRIETLEDYFSHLHDLVYGNGTNEKDNDFEFLKLPLDEPHFEIDANTRRIKVPQIFKENGVSVEGDEVSEILFFEIDRFYDSTDLSQTNIIIQWQSPGQSVVQYTAAFMPLIVHDPVYGDEKLVFGWPISSEITEYPGQLTFSVRFYIPDSGASSLDAKPVFSLSTLTQVVTINPGLAYNIHDLAPDNRFNLILDNRIKNSPQGIPDPPVVPFGIFYSTYYNGQYNNVNGSGNVMIAEQITQPITFAILGYKADAGTLTYSWERYDSETGEKEVGNFTSPIADGIYIPVKEYVKSGNGKIATYFSKTPYGEYESHIIDEDDFATMLKQKNELFVRCSKCELTPETIRPGVYSARIKNTLYNESKEDVDNPRIYWEVAHALTPILTSLSWSGNEQELLKNLELYVVQGQNLDDTTTYEWQLSGTKEITNTPGGFTTVSTAERFAPTKEGYYRLRVTNSRNGSEKTAQTSTVLLLNPISSISVNKTRSGNNIIATLSRNLSDFEKATYTWFYKGVQLSATTEKCPVQNTDYTAANYGVKIIITKGSQKEILTHGDIG